MNPQEKNLGAIARHLESLRHDREAIPWPQRVVIATGLKAAIQDGVTADLTELLELLSHDPKPEVRHAIANHLQDLPDDLFERLSQTMAADSHAYVKRTTQHAIAQRAKARKAAAKRKLGIDQISHQLKALEDRHGAAASRAAWRLAERYAELLVGSMVHDLRSILTHLRANALALATDATRAGASHKAARRVREDIDFLERTVLDMEQFTQSLATTKSAHKLLELVQAAREQAETVVRMDEAINIDGIRVEARIPASLTVWAVPHLLVPALTNIIKNAFEAFALPPIGGAAPAVSITARADAAWVDVIVKDNGMGFAPEEIAALKPFTPGRRNKTKRNSTGYGLPNAMRNIAAHGGTVNIESEMNRGTTVTVRLPLPNEDAKAGGAS